MKKLNFYLLPFLAAVILLSSCGKGAVGPQGSTGATGATGAVGPAGPAGTNGAAGSIIYSGTVAPPTTTGVVGDYYINLSTGLLYGPKTASGWGTGISLIGAAGAAGTPGTQIHNGSGAPATTLGVVGDYYLDTTNFLLYGPKTASGWGAPIALQGPEGNANVKTDTFTVDHGQWILESNANGNGNFFEAVTIGTVTYTPYLAFTRNNNSITQDVIDNGMVLVYIEPVPDFTPEVWEPLPLQYPVSDASSVYQYDIDFVTYATYGAVNIGFYFAQPGTGVTLPDLATYEAALAVNYRFKVITVTGQAGVFMAVNHVNLKNYTEVSRALGLWQQDKINNRHFR